MKRLLALRQIFVRELAEAYSSTVRTWPKRLPGSAVVISSHAVSGSSHRRFISGCCHFCPVLLLVCMLPMKAQDQQMQIYRSRVLVLTSYEPFDPISGPTIIPSYAGFLQKNPFIEIHLRQPISANRVNHRHLRVLCAEVGVFRDKSTGESWTIGKACKPL
jgi:hypothetical protein